MKCFTVFSLVFLLVFPAFAAGGMGGTRGEGPASGPDLEANDPLGKANAVLLDSYAHYRDELKSKSGPVIYAAGDDMVLIENGARETAHTDTRRYHVLKAAAHTPLTLYVLLISGIGEPLPAERLSALRSYRGLLTDARASLKGRELTPEQLARSERLIDCSMKFADSVLSAGKVSSAELRAFTRSQRADVDGNTLDAARDQIDTMDAKVEAWLSKMTSADRAALRVIVGGSHMPAVGNIAYQYFQAKLALPYGGRWAGETDGSGRLVFGEAMWDEGKALNLLATHWVDSGIGDFFFDDAERMHRDLLADAAERVIGEKLGRAVSR